jgi:hypothetical protein
MQLDPSTNQNPPTNRNQPHQTARLESGESSALAFLCDPVVMQPDPTADDFEVLPELIGDFELIKDSG